eukprot:SAG11_NODE_1268_length_5342_cov_1.710853_10_plen_279_part_00
MPPTSTATATTAAVAAAGRQPLAQHNQGTSAPHVAAGTGGATALCVDVAGTDTSSSSTHALSLREDSLGRSLGSSPSTAPSSEPAYVAALPTAQASTPGPPAPHSPAGQPLHSPKRSGYAALLYAKKHADGRDGAPPGISTKGTASPPTVSPSADSDSAGAPNALSSAAHPGTTKPLAQASALAPTAAAAPIAEKKRGGKMPPAIDLNQLAARPPGIRPASLQAGQTPASVAAAAEPMPAPQTPGPSADRVQVGGRYRAVRKAVLREGAEPVRCRHCD